MQKYFEDLQESFSFQKKIYFSGNDVIDAILHHDLPFYCREEVMVTVYGKLAKIETVSAMDLCTLFSNLLSNAIASANKCMEVKEKPQIIIHFTSGKKYFCIMISNSILTPVEDGKTKKADRNHGHGMYKIKHVMEKYGGRFEQNVEKQMMVITVYLPV